MTILAEVGDVRDFVSADCLVSWAGLAPSVYQSADTLVTGRITKRGSKHLLPAERLPPGSEQGHCPGQQERSRKHPKRGKPFWFDRELYKKRSAIERFFIWIEAF